MVSRRFSAALVACLLLSPAFAQEPAAVVPAAAARCTGVLCDLYYANKPAPAPGQPEAADPTHLPCRDFLCAAFGGRTPESPPPAAQQAAAATAEPPVTAPVHPVRRKKKARGNVTSAAAMGTPATR